MLFLKCRNLQVINNMDKKLIALLPIGGRFTMSVEEAVEAAKLIKPDLVIPMHYGSIVGTEEDAQEFKELCEEENIKCEILVKDHLHGVQRLFLFRLILRMCNTYLP